MAVDRHAWSCPRVRVHLPVKAMPNAADRAVGLLSLAVLLASATWFAGTAVAPALAREWSLAPAAAAWLTSSVQLGFIAGTLLLAFSNLADRFPPRTVFAAAAVLGALANAAFALVSDGLLAAATLRFATGVTLAGIYPVGMKLVASWSPAGLGLRLGVMVGALGLGTALPYLVRWAGVGLDWRLVAVLASTAAVLGGALVRFCIGDGPGLRTRARFAPRMAWRLFREPSFRLNALGYFGHMWELYAFWSLLPFWLEGPLGPTPSRFLLAFAAVAAGAVGCVGGGVLSRRLGERRVALYALLGSATACALSPFARDLPPPLLVVFVLLWGVVVVADSPQFSALAARLCPPAYTGTALLIQNGVGFAVTVVAIQCTAAAAASCGWRWAFVLLLPGPLFGALAMVRLGRTVA